MTTKSLQNEPYISSNRRLPEITLRGLILGTLLAGILAASTCYLGLKIGRTISSSIPAAIISMAILRWFKNSNILEHNIVQTAASAGEVIAASTIFTIPALVMTGYWDHFPWLDTFSIMLIGGLFGVLFSVPLRRAMIVERKLPYPEGIAAAEVLIAGDNTSADESKHLFHGALFAGLFSIGQTGLKVFGDSFQYWRLKASTVMGFGFSFSPILMAVGYLIGFWNIFPLLLGTIITWVIGIPIYGYLNGIPHPMDPELSAMLISKDHFKFVGVGAMAVGGIWSLIYMIKPIIIAVKSSIATIREASDKKKAYTPRTERDIPIKYVAMGVLFLALPLAVVFNNMFSDQSFSISSGLFSGVLFFSLVFAIFIGFVAAAICAYLTGIVGSTSLPVSGIIIATILSFSLILLVTLGTQVDFDFNKQYAMDAAAMAIIVGAVVAAAGTLSGDNLQDLKSGYLVGSTPWKQQLMLMLGTVVAAMVVGPVLQLLYNVYGMGDAIPRVGMDPTATLAAPQATLMAAVAKGVFAKNLQWGLIGLGGAIAVVAIIADEIVRRKTEHIRIPVLTLALGMYLPMGFITPMVLGGLIQFFAYRKMESKKRSFPGKYADARLKILRQTTLLASGVIAGEALMGIALAVPFAVYGHDQVLAIVGPEFGTFGLLLSFGLFVWLIRRFYKLGTRLVG